MPSTRAVVDSEPGSARATSVALTSLGLVTLPALGVVALPGFMAELAHAVSVAATMIARPARIALVQDRFTAVGRRPACVGSASILLAHGATVVAGAASKSHDGVPTLARCDDRGGRVGRVFDLG